MLTSVSCREMPVLKPGEKYKLVKNKDNERIAYEEVSFLSYTSSPEMIVVKTDNGQVLRVARHEIVETFTKK